MEQRKALAAAALAEAPAGERDFYLNEALAVTTDYVNLLSGALRPTTGRRPGLGLPRPRRQRLRPPA